jgi:hypothetical protein
VEYKAVLGEASGEASADWSSLGTSWAKSRQVTLSVTGGTESKLAAALDPKFGDNFSQNYSDWLKTIDENPKLIDFGVMPLSELFSGKVAATLDTALAAYLDNGLYVEARITPQALSGTIEVSGKSIDQRSYADRSGGAQLVVLDATSLTPVHNRTIYGAEKGDLWGELFEGTDALSATDYFCLFTVFNWQANMFPTGQPARWLTRCGATLESWERLGATSTAYVAYAFIGRSDSPSRQGLEQFDYDRGHETAFASVTTALVPARGGFQIPGSNLAVAAP